MNKQVLTIKLGRSEYSVEFLKSVTLKEAIEHFERLGVHEGQIRNAWKRANGKK